MLLEMAIGDAYGAGFEYAAPDFVRANHKLTGYAKHPKHSLVPGSYTDDTQMSIANAEMIVGNTVNREALAQAYVTAFKRDQREGYAGGFYRFLCDVKDGTEFLARMKPQSDKSGGAMRALPFGIYPDVSTVIEMASLQAAITHNTTDGINAAVAAALMAHYFLYNKGPKANLADYIAQHVPGNWADWNEPVGEKGWMAVRAAVTAVMSGNTMSEILRISIDFTGDVDTVAALALGAAAASPEVAQDLPAVLVDGLESGPYGREFLRDLDKQLMVSMAAQVKKTAQPSTTPAARRLLVVQSPEQWTGYVSEQTFLEIPANMDVPREEQAWFASGGDSSGKSFADYLISQGAVKVAAEIWSINYQ